MYDSIRIKKRIIHTTILQYHVIFLMDIQIIIIFRIFQSISPTPSHPIPIHQDVRKVVRSIFWGFEDIADANFTAESAPVLVVSEDLRSASAGWAGWGERRDGEKPREKPTGNWEMKVGNALVLGIDQILMGF